MAMQLGKGGNMKKDAVNLFIFSKTQDVFLFFLVFLEGLGQSVLSHVENNYINNNIFN